MNSDLQLNPRVIQVLQKQITEIIKRPPDSVKYVLNESDICDIQADIIGPVETPYYGGVFRCKLVLSSEFPKVPPKGYFLTKIFHPNVSEKGEICVNILKKDWNPSQWMLSSIFEVIRCLLIIPFPESSLNDEAGKLFMENYEEYAKHAKMITDLYAQPRDLTPTTRCTSQPSNGSFDEEFSSEKSLSFSNSSPTKSPGNALVEEAQFTKENLVVEQSISELKLEKSNSIGFTTGGTSSFSNICDDVLTSLTNTQQPSLGGGLLFKKSNSVNVGSGLNNNLMGSSQQVGGGLGLVGNTTKNPNEKIWKKRI